MHLEKVHKFEASIRKAP